MVVMTPRVTCLFRHSRESGNPEMQAWEANPLDPRFRGGDDEALQHDASSEGEL
jgi:hypothetical protein